MTDNKQWGSLAEAAERRGVSPITMRRYITQGLVYAERVGPRLIRIDLESVDRMGKPMQYESGVSA